ncbi:hypothetical protein [Streptococcus australis]|uniref:hypothetical protein n=1 Tax=Streptococcus australis TaxID=113107 RepID=UPI0018A05D40|nr:hypothetical protein [Streptococcus australis]
MTNVYKNDNFSFYCKNIDNYLSKLIDSEFEGWFYNSNLELLSEIGVEEQRFETKQEAYDFFKQLYEKGVMYLEEYLKKYIPISIISESLTLLIPLNLLSLSNANGEFNFNLGLMETFPKIWKNIKTSNEYNRVVQTTISGHLGIKKKSLDVIVNLMLFRIDQTKLNGNDNSLQVINSKEFLKAISIAEEIAMIYNFFQIISKENQNTFSSNTVLIENGKIKYPKAQKFGLDLLINATGKDYLHSISESKKEEVYKLYEKKLGISSSKVINTFSNCFSSKDLLNKVEKLNHSIFVKSKTELKKLVNLSQNTLTLKGLLLLIDNNMCLEYKGQDKYKFIFDNNEKITRKGLVKIEGNYYYNFGTMVSYSGILSQDLLNQDFLNELKVSDKEISTFMANQYSEIWLAELKDKLNKQGIWCEIQINNIEQCLVFPKQVSATKEIDFLLFDTRKNHLLIGEYKNWQDVSFSYPSVNKEQDKIKKNIIKHKELLTVLNSNKNEFFRLLNLDIDDAEIKLIYVFENRNVLSNTNIEGYDSYYNSGEIAIYSRVEFEKYIKLNKSNLLRMNKSL